MSGPLALRRRVPTLAWLCCLCVLLVGCAGQQPRVVPAESPAENADPVFWILLAETAIRRGEAELGVNAYARAAALTPDPQVAAQATKVAMAAQRPELALRSARSWVAQAPDDRLGWQALTVLALQAEEAELATTALLATVRLHPQGAAAGLMELPAVFGPLLAEQPAELTLFAPIRDQYSHLRESHYAYAELALAADDPAAAAEALTEVRQRAPGWLPGRSLRPRVLLAQGRQAAAFASMEQLLSAHPTAPDLRFGYARMLIDAGRAQEAKQQFERLLLIDPDNGEVTYALALLAFQTEDFDDARRYLLQTLASGRHRDEAYFYLGLIDRRRGVPEAALRWFSQIQGGEQLIPAQLQIADLLRERGELDEALTRLRILREDNPQVAPVLYVGEAELLLRSDEAGSAFELLEEALEQHPDARPLRYLHALAAEQIGRLALAERTLRAMLADDPDDAEAANALGYMLVVHTERLDEAEALLRRALALAPQNPAVLDSMGWLQFRKGDYARAEALLREAYDREPDPEIATHLGELLWTTGRTAEARRIWGDALQQAPADPLLLRTLERLDVDLAR